MNEVDFRVLMRAKRQIQREKNLSSFLWVGIVFSAVLRMLGLEFPLLYVSLFTVLLIALILSSDLLINFGLVSKSDLVKVIEKHIHSDPEMLTRYAASKGVKL